MFLPPVVLAIRSRYVLEAAVYTFTMFFSPLLVNFESHGNQPRSFQSGSRAACTNPVLRLLVS